MSDVETRFHEAWLGLVQPIEGLVVSVPVLVEAQCMARQPTEMAHRLLDLCPLIPEADGARRIADLAAFLDGVLGLSPDLFDQGDAVPPDLSLYVPEGRQMLRPTMGLRRMEPTPDSRYVALVWDLPDGLDLDRAETTTGAWEYPPAAKFDRLLRHCRVPIGLLTNRRVVRLVYAPHGESSGAITFRIDDMATVGGRPILDAFVMLLSATRFFGVAEEQTLPAILAESRKRQADVTNDLADQVFEALEILLAGFEAAAERDGSLHIQDALEHEDEHLHGGLLTVLLRLVFVLYAEDRGLLPVEHPFYAEHLSVLALFEQLRKDAGAYPDSMARRFGAWDRLLALFRAIYVGVRHGDLVMPARRGDLFDPHRYAFLEGWGPAGNAPVENFDAQSRVRVPSVDDGTVYRVLEKLVVFQGQRLSYKTLDVEQIGSVYEALMGYHVVRLTAPAVRVKLGSKRSAARAWVQVEDLLAQPAGRRAAWLSDELGFDNSVAKKLVDAVKDAENVEAAVEAVAELAGSAKQRERHRAGAGTLVVQPGLERRRTSSHYTPRSLSAPIVRRTLEPLVACLGSEPRSEDLLSLTVCDPAMGSGAFLVEACRFLADQVVAAWTREGVLDLHVDTAEDVVTRARRLVAQRCLYGVDKNPYAVSLTKLSLWLVTLAKDKPFTYLDHALRHGDSLVGLSFDQIRAFNWEVKPGQQVELFAREVAESLDEAVAIRQSILELAEDPSLVAQKEKERLQWDAEDALDRVRLIGDLVVGAFFAADKPRAREAERKRRLDLVTAWLATNEPAPDDLRAMQTEIKARIPVFHWMAEYPEVFYVERPDPLERGNVNRAAFIDAFVGNPPFAGKNGITESSGADYLEWLKVLHEGAHGNADLSAHFFRRAGTLLGEHGTMGLIATNTIAQGDTRTTGLGHLVAAGHIIYDARSMLWPGDAYVAVSFVNLAVGSPARFTGSMLLDGEPVHTISSRLTGKPERPDPVTLVANAGLSFQGSTVLGLGFTLSFEDREEFVARDPRNAERICPYLGGEELNTSPTQSPSRFVINFGQMALEEAERWPDLVEKVRRDVKPERDKNNRENYRKFWWLFGEYRPGLFSALHSVERCLVTARVTKHLCFSFQATNVVLNEKLYVFPLESHCCFTVLQSRVHEPWARLLSSLFGSSRSCGPVLNYGASDCFETFPFPHPNPRTAIPELEDIGERLYAARAKYMVDENVGLTITYNRLKDPDHHDARIDELRRLHEEMDRAVLAAYGWSDVAVPPFCLATPADHAALEAFQDEVIDRLFVLNAERAAQERAQGLGEKKAAKGGKGRGKKAKKGAKAEPETQAALALEPEE